MKLQRSFWHVTKIICTKNHADQSNNLMVISNLVITQSDQFEIFMITLIKKGPEKIIGTKNDADQSNNLKVISDLVITQSDKFEIFNDHLDKKQPRTFKVFWLEI